jgi:hypothetical protein
MSDEFWEFDCADCGAPVVWVTPPPSHRCAGCLWLLELPPMDAAEKAELRAYMLDQHIIGPD